MANYLDAFLLYRRKNIIDEKFIVELENNKKKIKL